MISDALHPDDDVCRQRFHQSAFEECDHQSASMTMRRPVFDFAFYIFLAWALIATVAAQDPVTPGQGEMRVWLEPAFMRPAVSAPIPGAKKTVLAAGFHSARGLEPCRRGTLEQLRLTWEQFFEKARAKAAADLAELQPRFERDS